MMVGYSGGGKLPWWLDTFTVVITLNNDSCPSEAISWLPLMLPQLFKWLNFPGDANVGNLRTWPGMVFFSCCPCCLLGKSSSGRTRHSQRLLFSFPVSAGNFHRKLSNKQGHQILQFCYHRDKLSAALPWEYECCNDCSPFARLSRGDSTLTPQPQHKSLSPAKVTKGGEKSTQSENPDIF